MSQYVISGVFRDSDTLTRALSQLRATGVKSEEVSFIRSQDQGGAAYRIVTGTKWAQIGAAGLMVGALISGVIFAFTTEASLALGSAFYSGPWVAALVGAVLGGFLGAILGAIMGRRLPVHMNVLSDTPEKEGSNRFLLGVTVDANDVEKVRGALYEGQATEITELDRRFQQELGLS